MHLHTSFFALAAGFSLCSAGFPQRAHPDVLRARSVRYRPIAHKVQAVAREPAAEPLQRRASPYLNDKTKSECDPDLVSEWKFGEVGEP